jgi:hypothetical protein
VNFLLIFLLLIPIQLGRHFWPEWSNIGGIRVDYLSPVLYLVDLIWISLAFVFYLKNKKVKFFVNKKIIVLVLLILVNILVAGNHFEAGYKWLRIGQYVWTIWYFTKNKENLKKYLLIAIPCWIILESFLGLLQVLNRGSLNGIFYWLGERRFNFNTIGIAQMSVLGNGLVRAYGTFSHPNSLTGFLLVSLMIYKKFIKNELNIFNWVVFWVGILGILVTGSRVVLVLTIFVFLKPSVLLCKTSPLKRAIYLGGILSLFLILFLLINKGVVGGWDKMGLQKRMNLNFYALEMIKDKSFFGVGLGNFLVELPKYQKSYYWLQPVHNVILLVISETGLFGSLVIIWLLKKIKLNKSFFWILTVILITGMFDHYWLTLPQNIWLLIIIFGLAIE